MTLEEHLKIVNELLQSPEIKPKACFCLAFATYLGLRSDGDYPSREIVEGFARCRDSQEAADFYFALTRPPV